MGGLGSIAPARGLLSSLTGITISIDFVMKYPISGMLFFFFVSSLVGQEDDTLSIEKLWNKWELVAVATFEPNKDNLADSIQWTTKRLISSFNSFKRTHGWKKTYLTISKDSIMKDCTINKKGKPIQCFQDTIMAFSNRVVYTKNKEEYEIIYFIDDILVLFHSKYFFDLYISEKKKSVNRISNHLMMNLIKKQFYR